MVWIIRRKEAEGVSVREACKRVSLFSVSLKSEECLDEANGPSGCERCEKGTQRRVKRVARTPEVILYSWSRKA